jgi:DNA-binding protein H-NS
MSWEYRKIDLNETPRRGNDIDVLCNAGADGWELVAILANNIAYLKRAISDEALGCGADEPEDDGRTHEVKPKYRDPATGETWSGRGRMATWLRRKQDAGEDIEKYRL